MNLREMLRGYIYEEDFKLIYQKKGLNIVNYKLIDHFEETKIIVRVENGNIEIKGKNLTVAKLLNDELLITGKIKNIELNVND